MAATKGFLLFCLVIAIGSLVATNEGANPHLAPLNRTSFPQGFVFGSGVASYQAEGAAFMYGKGDSIWDTFTHQHPEKIDDGSNGDIADDFYHRYKGDIALMKKIGLDAFRFSISWSRILPKGKISGGVNSIGVEFYNNLINELLSKGLTPYVTLFHWDLPQALENEYGGFLSPKIVEDFHDYVEFCFKTFGDRVKNWFTLNEPYMSTLSGYATGTMAPGRCSNFINNCTSGNSGTEPYIVGHYSLISHAVAVKLYREKYKPYQKGQIGITLIGSWFEPFSNSVADKRAAQRALDFMFGWYAHPITYGEYPKRIRSLVGNRLPKFTKKESQMLKKSYDILGVNYYTGSFASHDMSSNGMNLSYTTDSQANITSVRNGVPIGTPTDLVWLYVYPKGIRKLLLHIKEKYDNPTIYITENGMATSNNNKPIKEVLSDKMRILYHHGHLHYLLRAIKEGVNVKGYFIWSFLDVFEWNSGYTVGFGVVYVDLHRSLARFPKQSAAWFQKFLEKK